MARQTRGAITHAKARRVTIPAGKDYIMFSATDTVYVVGPDGKWPDSIYNLMQKQQETAYEKGLNDGADLAKGQAVNQRSRTMEETLQEVLTMIRQHHGNDQNQIVAVVLNELGKDRQNRVKAIQEDIARATELLGHAEACNNGFNTIRNGGFEALNFR